jgi:hypothetical protein
MADAQKICTKCKQPGEFYPRGRKRWCKECCKAYFREWYKKNPKKVKAIAKRKWAKPETKKKISEYRKKYRRRGGAGHENEKKRNLKRRLRLYGLSLEDHQKFLVQHDNRCAICRREERAKRGNQLKRLAIDHDHKTGAVRGLLCHACNNGLGCFEDTPELLEAAIRYLCGEQRFTT